MSLILDENGNMPGTSQLSSRGVQDLDLRSKLKPSAGDETDSHIQLSCFAALDFPERNPLQDPLVDHILFRLEEHVHRENEAGRYSDPTLLRRHEEHGKPVRNLRETFLIRILRNRNSFGGAQYLPPLLFTTFWDTPSSSSPCCESSIWTWIGSMRNECSIGLVSRCCLRKRSPERDPPAFFGLSDM